MRFDLQVVPGTTRPALVRLKKSAKTGFFQPSGQIFTGTGSHHAVATRYPYQAAGTG